MGDLDDLEFQKPSPEDEPAPPPPAPEPSGGRSGLWIGGVALGVVALGGLLYLGLRGRDKPAAGQTPPPLGAAPAAEATPSPLALPPLEGSDALVRELVKSLSAHPQLALWLAAEDLVRRAAGAVMAVVEDQPPRAYVDFLAPKSGFSVVERRGRTFVDPKSYARYDGFGDVVGSLDAAACVKVYRQLEPLFEAAYRELGATEGSVTGALSGAVRKLLETPEPQGDVAVRRVVKDVVVYEYVDSRLESLSPAQKHLLRLGPENGKKLRAKLREFLAALEPAKT
jgi:hypothetical protein